MLSEEQLADIHALGPPEIEHEGMTLAQAVVLTADAYCLDDPGAELAEVEAAIRARL
jgi:hypothetical protein